MEYDLVEVHSVRIFSDRTKGPKQIYGIIRLKDCNGHIDLYNQDKDNAMSTNCKDSTLPLTCPSHCFLGDSFTLWVLLKERHQHEDLDVGHGHYELWNMGNFNMRDKLIRSVFLGKDGYAVLHYSIVRNGIQATVKVNLITNERSFAHAIHGSVTAMKSIFNYNKYGRKYFQTTLFDAQEDEPKELQPVASEDNKFKIALSTKVVPVPLNHTLIIEADLWYKATSTAIGIVEPEYTRAIFSFAAMAGQKGTPIIEENVEVTVSWEKAVYGKRK